MGSGGGGSSSGVTTVRYAGYIEAHHTEFLNLTASYRATAIAANPYTGFSDIPIDVGFFGAGYSLASFPALYDIFGKFVAGLNIDAIWNEIYESTIDAPVVGEYVRAESEFLKDELDTSVLPRFMTGMRDINAVNSSSFIIGKGLLEDTRQKAVSKFSAELKYKLIALAQDRWKTHLAWNTGVVSQYESVMKHYFAIKQGMTEFNYSLSERNVLWSLEVMDYERAALGALQGAIKTKSSGEGGGGSKAAGALGGALSGAAMGATIGGPWGAAIGGVVGGVAGLLTS